MVSRNTYYKNYLLSLYLPSSQYISMRLFCEDTLNDTELKKFKQNLRDLKKTHVAIYDYVLLHDIGFEDPSKYEEYFQAIYASYKIK